MDTSQLACPARNAHKRLIDCHEQWHLVANNYMDPHGFRICTNSLIQNLRSVTWLLQKHKAQLPNFESWYPAWTESVADDPIMKWLIKSRNRIVKESDLELLSQAHVSLSFDWLNEYTTEWNMPPRYTTRQILIRILSGQPYLTAGLLAIERRWIDKALPDHELLDALAYVFNRLVEVVRIAHQHATVSECDARKGELECANTPLSTNPACMLTWDESRRLYINLANRSEITDRRLMIPRDEAEIERARQRYGVTSLHGDAIERVPQLIDCVKNMLAADKELATVALLMNGSSCVGIVILVFTTQETKRLSILTLAEHMRRSNADGVVLISEIWWAELRPDEDATAFDITPARERPDRKEALQILGLTRDGRQTDMDVTFTRDSGGEIIFGETFRDLGGQINLIEPIKRMWLSS